jgi:hypothetical protein
LRIVHTVKKIDDGLHSPCRASTFSVISTAHYTISCKISPLMTWFEQGHFICIARYHRLDCAARRPLSSELMMMIFDSYSAKLAAERSPRTSSPQYAAE